MESRFMTRIMMIFATITIFTSIAGAGGTLEEDTYHQKWCAHHSQADYLLGLMGTDQLRTETEWRYAQAVDTFYASHASTSPRFIWANQTKNACAKVIGYLKYPLHRRPTEEMVQKCDCFFARMSAY